MFLNDGKKVTGIFANIGGETKKVVSAWVNKDGIATKVYGSGGHSAFVAVGKKGASYYSSDGASWTAMSGLPETTFNSVAYGKNRFVCVGDGGKSYYSLDGKTWNPMSGLSNSHFYAVVFANGGFMAVGGDSGCYRSTDGETWVEVGSRSGTIKAMAYGDGIFVVVGNEGMSYYSEDGVEWTQLSGLVNSFDYNCITYGNGKFIASGTYGIATYKKGDTKWTILSSDPSVNISESKPCYGAAYGRGNFTFKGFEEMIVHDKYVLVGSSANYWSADGEDWYKSDLSTFDYYSVAFGKGRFVAVGVGATYYSLEGEKWIGLNRLQDVVLKSVCYSR
jgi:hypothetical protein